MRTFFHMMKRESDKPFMKRQNTQKKKLRVDFYQDRNTEKQQHLALKTPVAEQSTMNCCIV